jgi:hypothetical protein
MKYVEALDDYETFPRPWVFLAGGICNCPDWQAEIVKLLSDLDDGTLLNPRRKNFPIHDPGAARKQITWEFNAIKKADIFSMWFCAGPSDQPICMFELGANLWRFTPICIGIEPGYRREQDVRIQMELFSCYRREQDVRIQMELFSSMSPSFLRNCCISSTLEKHAENIRYEVEAWLPVFEY